MVFGVSLVPIGYLGYLWSLFSRVFFLVPIIYLFASSEFAFDEFASSEFAFDEFVYYLKTVNYILTR